MDTIFEHFRQFRRLHSRMGSLLTVAALVTLLSACATAPKPLSPDELDRINRADRTAARAGIPPITSPLTLEEAIARALKYNTQHRIRMLEQALALGQLDTSRFDILPKLLANAGYTWRDEENIRDAIDSVTGLPSLANPYISSERSRMMADIGLTWNLLDFGASYYTAKQNADRLLVAGERRRKTMHTLIQEVRTVYWRAVAAQKLGHLVKATIKEAEQALAFSRKIAEERVRSPGEALRYQRNLLENLRLLENVDRELSAARIELADLIGAPIGSEIPLAEPATAQPAPLAMTIERMEELALSQNAELREQFYNVRIATLETRKALIKLLPGISFEYGLNHDDDKYLINQQWQNAGLTVSLNLLNLLSAPSRMKVAEMGVKLAEARRMALQMALLTKVHLARHQYGDAMRQWQRADAIYDVDRRLSELALSREKTQTASNLDRIAASVTTILSSMRRYHAMAKVQEAASRVQASLGVEPRIGSLDDTELPELKQQIHHFLERWANPVGPVAHHAVHGDQAAPAPTFAATLEVKVATLPAADSSVRAPPIAAVTRALLKTGEPAISMIAGRQAMNREARARVHRGDTLYAIARRHKIPLRALIRANGLKPPFKLKLGQELRVPETRYYVVGSGDTVYRLSRRFGIPPKRIIKANLLRTAGYKLYPGQKLVLPQLGKTKSRPRTETLVAQRLDTRQSQTKTKHTKAHALATPENAAPAPKVVARHKLEPAKKTKKKSQAPAEKNLIAVKNRPVKVQKASIPQPPPAANPKPPSTLSARLKRLSPGAGGFMWPVQGTLLSSCGSKGGGLYNDCVNIAARKVTPVRAAEVQAPIAVEVLRDAVGGVAGGYRKALAAGRYQRGIGEFSNANTPDVNAVPNSESPWAWPPSEENQHINAMARPEATWRRVLPASASLPEN